MKSAFVIFTFITLLGRNAMGCGVGTHTEINNRAMAFYNNSILGPGVVKRILSEQQASFQAGAPFPDVMYSPICQGGNLHDIAEDIHWGRFQEVAWNYFRKTYPNPIGNDDAEKLIAFMMGLVSHQVADVSWHNLEGLKDGMIRMLADTTFGGDYNSAHTFADTGGDILRTGEYDSEFYVDWYIPSEDLANIITDYYGEEKVKDYVIFDCATELQVLRIIENNLGLILYPEYAVRSSIFLDELDQYFEGGMEDMAAWTRLAWDTTLWMAANGPENCHVEKNPLNLHCPKNSGELWGEKMSLMNKFTDTDDQGNELNLRENAMGDWMRLLNLTTDDIELMRSMQQIEKTYKGANIKNDFDLNLLQDMFRKSYSHSSEDYRESVTNVETAVPFIKLFDETPYANIGHSMHVADINGDKEVDLLIGAPGYMTEGEHSQGCVFILYSIDSKLDLGNTMTERDLSEMADLKLCSPKNDIYSRFGFSLTTSTNDEGNFEIYIGAPTLGMDNLTYQGIIYYYESYLNENGKVTFSDQPSDKFGGADFDQSRADSYGWSIEKLDSYFDNFIDPRKKSHEKIFTSGRYETTNDIFRTSSENKQNGAVSSLTKSEIMEGDSFYGWMGYTLHSFHVNERNYVAISSPKASSENGIGGKVEIRDVNNLKDIVSTLYGDEEFENFGHSITSGELRIEGLGDRHVLVIGSSTSSYRFNESFVHNHCGAIKIFDLTDYNGSEFTIPQIIKLDGKRLNSRFGSSVHIASDLRLNNNTKNNLLVGSPRHSKTNSLGLGEGAVYSFSDFSLGTMSDNCEEIDEAPCPEKWADLNYVPDDGDERSLFGFSIISTDNYKFISAPKSSTYARQSGVIYVFKN